MKIEWIMIDNEEVLTESETDSADPQLLIPLIAAAVLRILFNDPIRMNAEDEDDDSERPLSVKYFSISKWRGPRQERERERERDKNEKKNIKEIKIQLKCWL